MAKGYAGVIKESRGERWVLRGRVMRWREVSVG